MNIYTRSLIFVKRNTETVNQEHKNGYLWGGKERVAMTGTDPDLPFGLGNMKTLFLVGAKKESNA